MKVKDAYRELGYLIRDGEGELELIGVCGSSGVSYEVSLHASIMKKN